MRGGKVYYKDRLAGIISESKEMLYQYDRDYSFSSSKFEKRFGIKPTPGDVAVKMMR